MILEESGSYDVVVTTYDMIKSPALMSTLVSRSYWRCVVLDEVKIPASDSQNLRNPY